MSEFQPLIDLLFREEILRTCAMSPEQRMQLAFDLSDANIAWSQGAGDPEPAPCGRGRAVALAAA